MASRSGFQKVAIVLSGRNAGTLRIVRQQGFVVTAAGAPLDHSFSGVAAGSSNNNSYVVHHQFQTKQRQQHKQLMNQTVWFSDRSDGKESDKTNDEETVAGATPIEEEDANTEMGPEVKIAELELKVKELHDRMLRSLAEQDNTRRIAKRDVDDARQYAIKSFAKSMLDVSDNLERALNAVPVDMQTDKENHPVLTTLYEGIEMTERGLNKTFEMNGLTKFGKAGDHFDPNVHNALFEYPDAEKEPGTIGQVIKSGFMLKDRVLRPAEVGVIKKP